jgi:hypothetical protein
MIGPDKLIDLPSPVFYPAPALVAMIPFTALPVRLAGALFVFVSAALLAFGATRDGWHMLPLFPSVAFMTSSRLGQVSAFMCAALYIPRCLEELRQMDRCGGWSIRSHCGKFSDPTAMDKRVVEHAREG